MGVDAKYAGLDDKLAREIASYDMRYFRFDQPVPFNGLQLRPAKVRDYELFMDATSCLTLDKNTTREGIRMSNLDFLVQKLKSEDKDEGAMWSFRLSNLLDICFGAKTGFYCPHCGKTYTLGSEEANAIVAASQEKVQEFLKNNLQRLEGSDEEAEEVKKELVAVSAPKCPEDGEMLKMTPTIRKDEKGKSVLSVMGHDITSRDFDKLRQIILFQNIPDYRDESWVDPVLKKDREEKLALERKQNDVHASLEEKVVCLSISTHYKYEEIYDMSIRKFTTALARVDDLINYQIMRLATMTGLVSLPDGKKVEHWIYKPITDLYGDDYKTLQSAASMLSGVPSK